MKNKKPTIDTPFEDKRRANDDPANGSPSSPLEPEAIRKHIEERVRSWFGEPVIAVEDEIIALIATEVDKALKNYINNTGA